MTVEILREAAEKMRADAARAKNRFPDPLRSDGYRWLSIPHRVRPDCLTVQTPAEKYLAHYVPEGIGEHMAAWDPVVAVAVAGLLESAAGHVEYTGRLADEDVAAALDVACAYLRRELP